MRLFRLSLLLAVSITTFAYASPFSLPKPSPYFTAVSPIFGYDPAYGTLAGVAWFSYPTGAVKSADVRRDLNVVARFGPHGQISFRQIDPTWKSNFGLNYGVSVNNFFEVETALNSTEIIDQTEQLSSRASLSLRYNGLTHWELYSGPELKFYRSEATNSQLSMALKTGIKLDKRDDPVNSTKGGYLDLYSRIQVPQFNSELDTASAQISLDSRKFFSLSAQHSLALRGFAQMAWGEGFASHAGGSELLRGYLGGQFSAPGLAAVQTEYRFPIWSFIKGVTFYEAAVLKRETSVENNRFQSAGLGFRFGLPPDQSMSVRWDIAVNDQGQWQSFINFNQVF